MMLVTGQVLTNDDGETPASFPVSANNAVRQLAANGKTWKAYAEDLPSVGYTGGDTGNYAVRHVPLAYLTDVQDSAAGKETLVPFYPIRNGSCFRQIAGLLIRHAESL